MKRIVMNMNQFGPNYSIDLFYIHRKFRSDVLIKKEHIPLEGGTDFLTSEDTTIVNQLKEAMKAQGYHRAPIVLNLNLSSLFIEEMRLPALSAKELRNAVKFELNKLYPNYRERFIVAQRVYATVRKTRVVRILMMDKEHYRALIAFVKRLRQPLTRIVIASSSLYNAVIKYKLADPNKPFFFVNVTPENTMVVVHRRHLVGHAALPHGLGSDQVGSKKAYKLLEEQDLSWVKAMSRDLNRILYEPQNLSVKTIYLNIETRKNETIIPLLKEYLGREIIPVKDTIEVEQEENVKNGSNNPHPPKKSLVEVPNPVIAYLGEMGALIRPKKAGFNLPKFVRKPRVKRQKTRKVVVQDEDN